jgi:hypothetical protein
MVCQSSETAGHTGELFLRLAVAFVNTTALWASPRSILGINFQDRNPRQLCLVQDELLKLIKGPAMQRSPLRLSNRYPLTDAFERLNGNRTRGALSLGYKALANYMVGVFGKAFLLAGQSLETTLGRLGAFLLEFFSETAVSVSNVVNMPSRENLTVTVGRNVDNTQVNTQNTHGLDGSGSGGFTGCSQVEVTPYQEQIGFAVLGL